jgi:hypothetical protein
VETGKYQSNCCSDLVLLYIFLVRSIYANSKPVYLAIVSIFLAMVQDLNILAMSRDETRMSHPVFWTDEQFFDGPSPSLAIYL